MKKLLPLLIILLATSCSGTKTILSVVEDQPGYNCWPMIQSAGNRLICIYTIGKYHDTAEKKRGAYARYSDNGGKTWSPRFLIDENNQYGTSSIGKGTDKNGAALFWIRRMGTEPRMALYRTTDGQHFQLISAPHLNPNPMQITDIYHTPQGLECLWFSDDYRENVNNKSWGVLVSTDNGNTWQQRVIEKDLPKADWPTEPSVILLGDGKMLAIARCEAGLGNQFQLTSVDWGKTWEKQRTNISDVRESTPSLIYEPKTGTVHNYYYQRGAGLLKRRSVKVKEIFNHPKAWPSPKIIAHGGQKRPYDSGNANALNMNGHHYITYYSGDSINCNIIVVKTK